MCVCVFVCVFRASCVRLLLHPTHRLHPSVARSLKHAMACVSHLTLCSQIVILRARREHVELCFLDLVRIMVKGLEDLSASCELGSTQQSEGA